MFGLFKRKNSVNEDYFIYKTQTEKYRMLIKHIAELVNDREVVVGCFFEDTEQEVSRLLEAAQIKHSTNENSFDGSVRVKVVQVGNYQNMSLKGSEALLLAEIYPIRSTMMEFLANMNSHGTINCYTSMDSPFFETFGGDRMLALMDQLGMVENERIQHSMVTKSIIKAQEKIEAQVKSEYKTASLEEWVAMNLAKK